jgi:hypothetical protein
LSEYPLWFSVDILIEMLKSSRYYGAKPPRLSYLAVTGIT